MFISEMMRLIQMMIFMVAALLNIFKLNKKRVDAKDCCRLLRDEGETNN